MKEPIMSSDIVRDPRILNYISKKYHLSFCRKFKYYEGNAYNNNKGEPLPHYFSTGGRTFVLKYQDGCFNPFLREMVGDFWYRNDNNEPAFPYNKTTESRIDRNKFHL